jgi:ubiquinone biosynthesis protein
MPPQILAVKSDYLPEAYTRRLGLIYDCLPAMKAEKVNAIIRREFGLPTEDVFMFFDPKPIAAASISQARGLSVCQAPPGGV